MAQLVGIVYDGIEPGRNALSRLVAEGQGGRAAFDALAVSRTLLGGVIVEPPSGSRGPLTLGPFWRPFLALLLIGTAADGRAGSAVSAEVAAWLDDTGIDRGFMRELAGTLRAGCSGVFLVAPGPLVHRLAPALGREGGTMFYAAINRTTVGVVRPVTRGRAMPDRRAA